MATWQPYREPLSATLTRTVAIAVVVGGVLALSYGKPKMWLLFAALVFWPSFGGHWIEILFLNWLRPRLPEGRVPQVAARLGVWFAGGVLLGVGIVFTMRFSSMTASLRTPAWWVAGVAFIAVELIAHLGLAMRKRPSFYSGRG
jgi:hypothetical protein